MTETFLPVFVTAMLAGLFVSVVFIVATLHEIRKELGRIRTKLEER